MAARVADETHGGRLQADKPASGPQAETGRHGRDGVALSDPSPDAVANGAPQRFYPLAEMFRMVTGARS